VCSARLIGKQAFLDTVQRVKIVEYTWEGILPEINSTKSSGSPTACRTSWPPGCVR
jgi:hypothetical protein